MSTSSTRRIRFAALAVVGAVALTGIAAGPASAHKGPGHKGKGKAAAHAGSHGRSADKMKGKGKGKAKAHPKPVKFAAVGSVTAVDVEAGTVTVAVKGGNSGLRGKTATFAVSADARVRRDDVAVSLAELQAGDHVAMKGVKNTSGAFVAMRVNAESPEPVEVDQPAETGTGGEPLPTETAPAPAP